MPSREDTDDISAQLSMEEAIAIMKGGLGEAELAVVASFCAPLYWVFRDEDRRVRTHNASCFFLNAGQGIFGVTAAHVIAGWQRDAATFAECSPLRLAGNATSVQFEWAERQIAFDAGIDIATFRVSAEEVQEVGKTVLTGFQKTWPPKPPAENCGIYYCGFPQVGTEFLDLRSIQFGAVRGSGVASAVNDRDVVCLFQREYWIPEKTRPMPPEGLDYGGISGGLMLTVIQGKLRSWSLSGVIYEGPSTSDDPNQAIKGFEMIRARRAHFIRPDGTLDTALWHSFGGR